MPSGFVEGCVEGKFMCTVRPEGDGGDILPLDTKLSSGSTPTSSGIITSCLAYQRMPELLYFIERLYDLAYTTEQIHLLAAFALSRSRGRADLKNLCKILGTSGSTQEEVQAFHQHVSQPSPQISLAVACNYS